MNISLFFFQHTKDWQMGYSLFQAQLTEIRNTCYSGSWNTLKGWLFRSPRNCFDYFIYKPSEVNKNKRGHTIEMICFHIHCRPGLTFTHQWLRMFTLAIVTARLTSLLIDTLMQKVPESWNTCWRTSWHSGKALTALQMVLPGERHSEITVHMSVGKLRRNWR